MPILEILTRKEIDAHTDELAALFVASKYPAPDFKKVPKLFVLSENSKPIAAAGLACYHGKWCLRVCVVHPKHRGNGYQRQLIATRLQHLAANDVHSATVWVRPENVVSMNNVLDAGFRFVPEKPREYHGHLHYKLRYRRSVVK